MDPAWILGGALLLFAALGAPIAIALALAAAAALWAQDLDLVMLAQRVLAGSQSYTLLAVPCFVLSGELMAAGGLSRRLIDVAYVLVRRVTGGLGMVTVIAGTFFAAISGASAADTAAVGKVMIPEMEKRGYDRGFAAALAICVGPIAVLIPPSIPMLIWAFIAELSVVDLFLAGIVPGLMIAAAMLVVCYVMARVQGVPRETEPARPGELWAVLREGKWSLAAPLLILGGIYTGVFTPTEAAAVGVFYGLVIGMFVHRELKAGDLPRLILDAMRTTTIAVFILSCASAFSWLIAVEQLPQQLGAAMIAASDNPYIVLLSVNLLLLLIGAFMDNLAAMVILGGVLISIGKALGLDPVHLAVIVVMNFAIGTVTPPFGYSLFVGSAISGLSIEQLTRPLLLPIAAMLAVLGLVTYFPAFSLFLVR